MTEEKKPWRAKMPPRHLGKASSCEMTCHEVDVEELVNRANAELDALRTELAAKEARIADLEAREKELCAFGAEPEDSARLLKLREAIDEHLSWPTDEERDDGDYEACVEYSAKRIRELTEWRPMKTAPHEEILALCEHEIRVVFWRDSEALWKTDLPDGSENMVSPRGWLPLPEASK